MTPQMERLLERLQSGWKPRRDEIDMRIPQRELARWEFWPSRHASKPHMLLVGWPVDTDSSWPVFTEPVLWIDADLRWALCDDGFWWLQG
ncbi:hypothetical protein SAMN05216338_106318 [Bradyrhizobium sp. Rc2d]|uniref:hypothetical protein n=1 Tax=Bradyrhizobium sp. Rc2d TaxID=1855321 RepID=UPI000890950B|nr:hypothetical protein [Bradyrhizobium sp. Rc2d]SDJ74291.1 hypothetical protein SAMN05216338_106318 [Bradyrhizobium sp. Rc2d]